MKCFYAHGWRACVARLQTCFSVMMMSSSTSGQPNFREAITRAQSNQITCRIIRLKRLYLIYYPWVNLRMCCNQKKIRLSFIIFSNWFFLLAIRINARIFRNHCGFSVHLLSCSSHKYEFRKHLLTNNAIFIPSLLHSG